MEKFILIEADTNIALLREMNRALDDYNYVKVESFDVHNHICLLRCKND